MMGNSKSQHKVYQSAIDRWVLVLIFLSPVLGALLGVYLIAIGRNDDAAIMFATAAVTLLVVLACTLPCRYTLLDDTLSLRCGIILFRQVPYADIQSVEPSSTLRSGPALSMRRVIVKTSKKSHVLSPKDREQFIEDLTSRMND